MCLSNAQALSDLVPQSRRGCHCHAPLPLTPAPRVAYRFQLTYEKRRCLTMFCLLWVCVELEQIRGTNPKPQHQQQHQQQQQNYATTTSKTSARETRVKGVREEHKVRKSTKTIIQIILFITPLRNYILFTLSSVMMRPPSRVEFRRVDSHWEMRMKMDKRTVSQGPALLWVCSVVAVAGKPIEGWTGLETLLRFGSRCVYKLWKSVCILTYENHVVALSSAGEECGLVLVGGASVCVYLAWGLPHHCHQIDSYCASLTFFLYVLGIALATSLFSCGFSGCNWLKKKKIVPTMLAPCAPLLIGSPANFAIKFHLKLQLNTDRAGGKRDRERERGRR